MSSLFERAKLVIDQLIPVAEGLIHDGTPVDAMVKKRLHALSGGYGWGLLNIGRKPIDYTKLTTHIAYMYRSFAAHADWVNKALCLAPSTVRTALNRDEVQIASIGGGPGSDLAGVLKFAERHGLTEPEFHFTVLDREPNWHRARRELVATYDGEMFVTQTFQLLDLADGSPWTSDWDFAQSNLFVFFLAQAPALPNYFVVINNTGQPMTCTFKYDGGRWSGWVWLGPGENLQRPPNQQSPNPGTAYFYCQPPARQIIYTLHPATRYSLLRLRPGDRGVDLIEVTAGGSG